MKLDKMKVLSNKLIAPEIYEIILSGEIVKDMKNPGQFVNVSTGDNSLLLKRPISICEINEDSFKMIYRVEGQGTKLISQKKENDEIEVLGPLGNGFKLVENKKVVLIGGGIGVPPLIELGKQLKNNGCEVTFVLGFLNKEAAFYIDVFKEIGNIIICTMDGSLGFKGNVIEAIERNRLEFDCLYACGPTGMLKALDKKYQGTVEGYLSFEERMACGIGACFGCVCKTKTTEKGYMRVCKEGPVFELGSVTYE